MQEGSKYLKGLNEKLLKTKEITELYTKNINIDEFKNYLSSTNDDIEDVFDVISDGYISITQKILDNIYSVIKFAVQESRREVNKFNKVYLDLTKDKSKREKIIAKVEKFKACDIEALNTLKEIYDLVTKESDEYFNRAIGNGQCGNEKAMYADFIDRTDSIIKKHSEIVDNLINSAIDAIEEISSSDQMN